MSPVTLAAVDPSAERTTDLGINLYKTKGGDKDGDDAGSKRKRKRKRRRKKVRAPAYV